MNAATCKNCESELNGAYCARCGQDAHTHRYTGKHILHEVFHSITHTDRSALAFLQKILIRPGDVARDLFAGRRKRYFNLFTFFVLSISVFALSSATVPYYELLRNASPDRRMSYPLMREAYNLMIGNARVLSFFMMPLYAVFSWLLFRKLKYNFAEHVVYNTILYSVYILFYAAAIQFARINNGWVIAINYTVQLAPLVYMSVGNRQLFENSWFVTILKTILQRIGVIILIWILALLAAGISLYLMR